MRTTVIFWLGLGVLLLACAMVACKPEPVKPKSFGGELSAVNFSSGEVMSYGVTGLGDNAEMSGGNRHGTPPLNAEGYPGESGESCCVMLVQQWRPGMQVEVHWTFSPKPGQEAYELIKVYTAIVNVPPYKAPTHGAVLYFMPGNRVKFVVIGDDVRAEWSDRPAENDPFLVEGKVDEAATREEQKGWTEFVRERLANKRQLHELYPDKYDENGEDIVKDKKP